VFEKINEQIQVLVHFTFAKPIPLLFDWKGKKFKITEINFTHLSREGNSVLVHYAVSTQKEAFNITFNTHELIWTLDEIFFEGFIKDKSLNESKNAKNYNAH
jgi:hypothetical protein